MGYVYKEVLSSSIERRDNNIDRIFYLQDRIKRIERECEINLKSKNLVDKEAVIKIKTIQVKDLVSQIDKIQLDNQTIDAQILEKWMIKNGQKPRYEILNGNSQDYMGI